MKFAVIGCGAVGSYYGAKLLRAGHAVHFLLRSDYEIVRQQGVRVLSAEGEFHVQPACARQPQEIGPVDTVLIALKTTANDQFPRLLPPLLGPETSVVTLQNGLGNEEALARWAPPGRILGGLCFVCLNRVAPGVIDHQAHGKIVLGEFLGPATARAHRIAQAIQGAGVPCVVTDSLARARWEKLVWNIPFNGLGVASAAGYDAMAAASAGPGPDSPLGPCLTTDRLLADSRWLALVRELMAETIAAARAEGHPVEPGLAETMIRNTHEMGAYQPSTVLDFNHGRPLELQSMFGEPLRRARAAGVATPRLARLTSLLGWLEARRQTVPPSAPAAA